MIFSQLSAALIAILCMSHHSFLFLFCERANSKLYQPGPPFPPPKCTVLHTYETTVQYKITGQVPSPTVKPSQLIIYPYTTPTLPPAVILSYLEAFLLYFVENFGYVRGITAYLYTDTVYVCIPPNMI